MDVKIIYLLQSSSKSGIKRGTVRLTISGALSNLLPMWTVSAALSLTINAALSC